MRAVVTGGGGFIGSTLVDRLLADGAEVVVIDDFSSGDRSNLAAARSAAGDRLVVHEADITDASSEALVEEASPEVLFHLAAQADVRVSVAEPARDAVVNVVGSLRMIDAARRGGARRVVFASSGGTIYGEPPPEALPVNERHPQNPLSPYGVAKKAVGDYLLAFHHLHGLSFAALALSNVYGPRQDPHGEAGVVAIFAGHLLAGAAPTVFGTGDQTRDFVYVEDVVDAFVRAAALNDSFLCNIGTGVETSVNELYAAMATAAGADLEPQRAPARIGELGRSSLDPTLSSQLLGWTPSTDLAVGLAATLAWFRGR